MTATPHADRPHMPGYGIRAAGEGTGLLPWTWAVERLVNSHDYWLATARAIDSGIHRIRRPGPRDGSGISSRKTRVDPAIHRTPCQP